MFIYGESPYIDYSRAIGRLTVPLITAFMFRSLSRGSAHAAGKNNVLNVAIQSSAARHTALHQGSRRSIAATRRLDESISSGNAHKAKFSPVWASRVKIPWVEALQARREAEESMAKGVNPLSSHQAPEVDLTPKRMEDSSVTTVSPLNILPEHILGPVRC